MAKGRADQKTKRSYKICEFCKEIKKPIRLVDGNGKKRMVTECLCGMYDRNGNEI